MSVCENYSHAGNRAVDSSRLYLLRGGECNSSPNPSAVFTTISSNMFWLLGWPLLAVNLSPPGRDNSEKPVTKNGAFIVTGLHPLFPSLVSLAVLEPFQHCQN